MEPLNRPPMDLLIDEVKRCLSCPGCGSGTWQGSRAVPRMGSHRGKKALGEEEAGVWERAWGAGH